MPDQQRPPAATARRRPAVAADLVTLLVIVLLAPLALAVSIPAPPEVPPPAPEVRFEGGDGRGCEHAVVVVAPNERAGVRAQRWWVWSKNPGAVILDQKVASVPGHDFETFDLELADHSRRSICFDITPFFGKP